MLSRALLPIVAAASLLLSSGCGITSSNSTDATTTTTTTAPPQTMEARPDTTNADAGGVDTDVVVAGVDFSALELPPGEPYDEYELIVDDTDTVEVEVPTAWSDQSTDPGEVGATYESGAIGIQTSTDLTDFFDTWTAPGQYLHHYEVEQTTDLEELERQAERVTLPESCSDSTRFDYDDGFYTGVAELWSGCPPSDSAYLMISTFVEGDYLLVGVVMLTDADIEAAVRVIETFSFIGE